MTAYNTNQQSIANQSVGRNAGNSEPINSASTAFNTLADFFPKTNNNGGKNGKFSAIPQIESENFKKWFGDSKVVDEQGKPLAVYHGSTAEQYNKAKAGIFPPVLQPSSTGAESEQKTRGFPDFLNYNSTQFENVKFSVSSVWTGSAADYEQPSLQYIGSGEGQQAFGWGGFMRLTVAKLPNGMLKKM